MNRIIWMGIGVAIGVIAFRKVTEAQSALGPEGLNRAVGRLADGLSTSPTPSAMAWASGSPNSAPPSASRRQRILPPAALLPAGMRSGASRERISKYGARHGGDGAPAPP